VKKNVMSDVVSANVSSFVPGTCQVDVSTAVGAVLRRSSPGIPGLKTTGPTGTPAAGDDSTAVRNVVTVRRPKNPAIPGLNTTGPTGIPVNNPIPAPVGIPVSVVDPSECAECAHGAAQAVFVS
jgi:hypothetical protein